MNRIIPTMFLLFAVFSAEGFAQTYSITGTVKDTDDNTFLSGANIIIEGTQIGAATDANGKFTINNIAAGAKTLIISYVGYFSAKKEVTGSNAANLEITLKARTIEGKEVVVTGTRAIKRETPVAFSNVSREDIEAKYDLQDLPLLLDDVPGVYSYSETGGPIGYTYMRVRGFDQSRIGVMLNGIPLNDPESHQVYWVDLADFGENIQDVQIQRGVGNSLYGSAAIGGSVNVTTSNFSNERKISFSTGYGSYRTRKATIGMSSGLIDDKYAVYGRFSRLLSDGYRNEAWADLWSYFFSFVRFDDKFTNKLNIYGGPERTHLTFEGVTRAYLDGKVTGNRDEDRKHNPLQGPDEIDNTFQPHYELHTEYFVNDNLHFTNALFYTSAKGFFRNFKSRRDLFEYNLGDFTTTDPAPYANVADFSEIGTTGEFRLTATDLERRRWVDNYQYGIIPKIQYKHDRGTLTAGAELRLHSAEHWGEILWVPVPIAKVKPGHRYYDYEVDKQSYSVFVHESYALTPRLNFMADLQYAYHRYDFHDDKRNGIAFDTDYNFITPRVGLNFNYNDEINFFGNFSIAQREPTFRSLYDAQFAYSNPLFSDPDFTNPLVKDELMFDYETGFSYTSDKLAATINLYYMDFRDEIVVFGGQVDEEGVAVAGNADKSFHTGIEIGSTYKFRPELTFGFNAAFSRDELVEHSEFYTDFSTTPFTPVENNYDGNRIGGFPSTVLNATSSYIKKGFTARLHYQFIGEQFLDNSENERKNPERRNVAGYIDKTIDSFSLVNLRLSYELPFFKGLKRSVLSLSINNLFDELYETAGYLDAEPVWIPGPKRNFYFGLKIEM